MAKSPTTTLSTFVDTTAANTTENVHSLEFASLLAEFRNVGASIATAAVGRTRAYLMLATNKFLPEGANKQLFAAMQEGGKASPASILVYGSEIDAIYKAARQPNADFAHVAEVGKGMHGQTVETKQLSAIIVKLAREQNRVCAEAKKDGKTGSVTLSDAAISAIVTPDAKPEKSAEEKTHDKVLNSIMKELKELDTAKLKKVAQKLALITD